MRVVLRRSAGFQPALEPESGARGAVAVAGVPRQRPARMEHAQQPRGNVTAVRRVHAIDPRQGRPAPQGVIPEAKPAGIGVPKSGQAIQ